MDFHPSLRYSFRDSHFPALHFASRRSFFARGTLPYHAQMLSKGSNKTLASIASGFPHVRTAPAETGLALMAGFAIGSTFDS